MLRGCDAHETPVNGVGAPIGHLASGNLGTYSVSRALTAKFHMSPCSLALSTRPLAFLTLALNACRHAVGTPHRELACHVGSYAQECVVTSIQVHVVGAGAAIVEPSSFLRRPLLQGSGSEDDGFRSCVFS